MLIEELYKLYLKSGKVTTDSRNCPEGSLFFALKGDNFDGNLYAAKALENGCSLAVVDNAEVVVDERYVLMEDVLTCLQSLANYHRRMLRLPVIGITGTNGKTTTKELVSSVLSKKYNVHYTKGNLNNHIGVPLTLLELSADHNIAVVEMGANHPGEIAQLCRIAEPTYGLITNVGMAHLEGFGSFDGVVKTKSELYDYIKQHKGQLFANGNNSVLMEQLGNYSAMLYGLNNDELDVDGRIVENNPYITIQWRYGGESHRVRTHFIGEYNGENMLAAVAIGLHFSVESSKIEIALSEYVPANNRSQLVKTERNSVVVDAYNANPTSMKAALENFDRMDASNKMVILGDMLELGVQSVQEHERVITQLKGMSGVEVILVGKEFSALSQEYQHFLDNVALIEYLQLAQPTGKTILLKGSHGIGLEKCVSVL